MPVHTHGDRGGVGGAAPGAPWAPWEHRLWLEPASCQRSDVIGAVAAALPLVEAACRFVVVLAAGAARAAAAAPARAETAGAGSPRDSARSRRRVLMMSSRDAICRWSEAIVACSAVGGGRGAAGQGGCPPYPPPPPGARAAARRRPLAVSRGWCAREKGCQRRTKGREDLGALKEGGQLGGHPRLVAHRAQGARAREGEDAGASQKKNKRIADQLGSLTTCRFTIRGLKHT